MMTSHITINRFALCLCAVLAAGLLAIAPAPAFGAGKVRPWKSEPRLSVNLSSAHRSVVSAGRAEGELQLRALCARPGFEEIWAYLPGEKLWIELGCCERTTRDGNYIGIEIYIYKLLAKHHRLAIYHIHPKTAFIRETFHADKRLLKTVEEALPSVEDINAAELISRRFWRERPRGKIAWRIVSRHGVTAYGLTPAGRAAQEVDAQAFLFGPLDADELTEAETMPQPTAPGPEVNRLIAEAVQRLNGKEVFVAFQPFDSGN